MAGAVYVLGMFVAFACGWLLLRGYSRGKQPLLLWSGLCFLGLAVSNLVVFIDLQVFPDKDYYTLRLGIAAASMLCLLYGLIWEDE